MIKVKKDDGTAADVVKIGYNNGGNFAEFSKVYEANRTAPKLLYKKPGSPDEPDTDWISFEGELQGDFEYISSASGGTNGTTSSMTIVSDTYPITELYVYYNGVLVDSSSPESKMATATTENEAQGCVVTVSLTDTYTLSITAEFYYA